MLSRRFQKASIARDTARLLRQTGLKRADPFGNIDINGTPNCSGNCHGSVMKTVGSGFRRKLGLIECCCGYALSEEVDIFSGMPSFRH